jgi:predicted phage terminase large subunit-like protein
MNSLIKSLQSDPKAAAWLKRAISREKQERSLPEFIENAWSVIEPGTPYIDNWHIHLIAEYLQAVNIGQVKRLIINIPPRHMKSIEVTVCYPAWTWTREPHKRFIKISYADTLSRKHNIMTRDIISSPWYQGNWGDKVILKSDVNRQNEFENGENGLMYSTSVGGALTGNGADVIIIDDPQDPVMAYSEAGREMSINFFTRKLQSRLNNAITGAFIIIMQRLHERDLTGYILAEELGYEHLCLPAEAEQRTVITFPISKREIVREPGDILNAGRFTHEVFTDLRKTMGSVDFAGQYQQKPAPAEGIIFKREWMSQFYTELPANTTLIQTWDLPFTKSEASAKCAGIVMAKKGSEIYIVDVVNEKMEFTESVAAIRTLTGKYPKARAKVIENKANGPAIVSLLKKEIPGMVEFNPRGGKEERARSVTPYFEAGNIYFPNPATHPWVNDFILDLLNFPNGVYKDTVDATVQGILYLYDKTMNIRALNS